MSCLEGLKPHVGCWQLVNCTANWAGCPQAHIFCIQQAPSSVIVLAQDCIRCESAATKCTQPCSTECTIMQVGSWHTAPGSNQSYQHNQPLEQSALVQQHPQQHQQQQLLNSGSISHHSASHLSRHSSAGSDAQQSDILPSDALLVSASMHAMQKLYPVIMVLMQLTKHICHGSFKADSIVYM